MATINIKIERIGSKFKAGKKHAWGVILGTTDKDQSVINKACWFYIDETFLKRTPANVGSILRYDDYKGINDPSFIIGETDLEKMRSIRQTTIKHAIR